VLAQGAVWADVTVEGLPADAELAAERRDLGLGLAHGDLGQPQLGCRHLERRTAVAAAGAGCGDAGLRALDDQGALELGQRCEDAEHQLAGGPGGVDRRTLAGQHLEADTSSREVVHQVDEIAQVAAEPVQLPDHEGIALAQRLAAGGKARPVIPPAGSEITGDTLVVPKLDRLARSVPDARSIADALVARGVKLALGASVYDPIDPMGKMFFNILATFAEFEADLIRLRTREGMAIARARGKLRGKKPKLSDKQQKELRRMHDTGEYAISDLVELFTVSRPTVYRTLKRQRPAT